MFLSLSLFGGSNYLGVGLLNQRVGGCENAKLLSKVTSILHSHQQCAGVLLILILPDIRYCQSFVLVMTVVLVCISPMTKDVEHLLDTWISSHLKCLFKSLVISCFFFLFHLFYWLSLYSWVIVLYILSDMHCKYFSQSVTSIFIFLPIPIYKYILSCFLLDDLKF